MSYKKRDWDTTGNEVTKEDFKRIENGIETNDKTIAEQGKQINVLASMLNGVKIYKSLVDLGLTSEATYADVAKAMQANSILITQEFGEDKPRNYGTVTVKKSINDNRVAFEWVVSQKAANKTEIYVAHYHTDGGFSGWKRLDITDITTSPFPFASGFSVQNANIANGIITKNNRITVYFNAKKTDGTALEVGMNTIGILPTDLRPKLTVGGWARVSNNTVIATEIQSSGAIRVFVPSGITTNWIIGTVDFYLE